MNITKSRKFFMVLTALFAMGAVQVPASATFIEGGIGFGGLFNPTGGTGVDLSDATGVSIGFAVVTDGTGDFAPAIGSAATFNQIDFNPANTPITPLWSVNAGATTYSFDLLGISLDFQDADQINLSGNGILMANGFDDTPGAWTFSGQQGNVFFTFSAITIAEAVAEPSTILLLGVGFLGLALTRKRIS